jgi:hypothetical protein
MWQLIGDLEGHPSDNRPSVFSDCWLKSPTVNRLNRVVVQTGVEAFNEGNLFSCSLDGDGHKKYDNALQVSKRNGESAFSRTGFSLSGFDSVKTGQVPQVTQRIDKERSSLANKRFVYEIQKMTR